MGGRYNKIQETIYNLLHAHEFHDAHKIENELSSTKQHISHVIRGVLVVLIAIGIISMLLESVDGIRSVYGNWILITDYIIAGAFSIEYLLRLWSITQCYHYNPDAKHDYSHPFKGRLKYAKTPMAIIDLLSSFPFFFPFTPIVGDMGMIRILRIFRFIRILNLGQFGDALEMIHNSIKKKKNELYVAVLAFTLMLILVSTIMFNLEHESQSQIFSSIPATFWWGIQALTQNSFSDIAPITPFGRMFSGLVSVIAVGGVGIPISIIVSGMIEEYRSKHAKKIVPNTVKCKHCGEMLEIVIK